MVENTESDQDEGCGASSSESFLRQQRYYGHPLWSYLRRIASEIRAVLYQVLLEMLSLLPPGAAFRIASRIGEIKYRLKGSLTAPLRKEMVERLGATAAQASQWAARLYKLCVWEEVESRFYPRLDRQSVGKFIDIRGIENLDRALERRGGAILCTGHIRGLFTFLVALKLLGYNVNAIRRTPKSAQGPIARWFNRRVTLVSGGWCKFLWMERDNLRVAVQAANALRRNEIILVLIDARFGNEAVEADFLNRRLPLTSGHIVLAQACRAPLLSFFVRSSDTGLPRIAEIEEPYYASDDVDASVQHCISRLERKIVDSPADWIWFHERDVWSRQAAEASTPGRRDALT